MSTRRTGDSIGRGKVDPRPGQRPGAWVEKGSRVRLRSAIPAASSGTEGIVERLLGLGYVKVLFTTGASSRAHMKNLDVLDANRRASDE